MPEPSRIRVAHVVYSLGIGGLETGMINLLSQLDSCEFEHRIYCMKDLGPNTARALALGVGVEKVGELDSRNRGIILKLARAFRAFRPHVVHSRNFGCIDAIPAARLARVPRVVHGEHGWDTFDPDGRSTKRRFARGCLSPFVDRYITVSRDLAAWLAAHRGFFGGKITTIHNGVDLARFKPPARDRGAPGSPLVFGTVGRLVPIKDQAGLIAAFAALDPARARLTIVGDGPLRASLESRAREQGCAGRVTFAGASTDVAAHYDSFDVFVLPSLNEGISNTILEAMASGLPVVATSVGGNPELVEDGVTGRLAPKQDQAALTAALGGYLASPGIIARQGAAGRQRAEREFSIPAMARGYRRVYLEVLRRPVEPG